MPKQTSVFVTKDTKGIGTTFANADSTNIKTIFTPPADGAIVTAIAITNTTVSANDLILHLNDGTITTTLGHVDINASSGTNGTANATDGLNLLNLPWLPVDGNGNHFLKLGAGDILRANVRVAIATGAANKIDVTVFYEAF